MKKKDFRYIYGPVFSWRLGRSLGIDPLSGEDKVCTFDCTYCQIGKTKVFSDERRIFVPTKDIIDEVCLFPSGEIDYITFSGNGEPSLAKNLGEIISGIRKIRKEKIAIITNSSLMDRIDAQDDLLKADFIIAKLDAYGEDLFIKVNQPMEGIKFKNIISGIKKFKTKFTGKLALQVMFINENKRCAKDIANIIKEINPNEVQINTPLRKCNEKPLAREELEIIKSYFKGMKVKTVYDVEKKSIAPVNKEDTRKRHGCG